MPDQKMVNIVHPDAPERRYSIPESDVPSALEQGFHLESSSEAVQRVQQGVTEETYGGVGSGLVAGGAGLARGFTGGVSDAIIASLGGGEHLEAFKEAHPYVSAGTEIAGTLIPGGQGGLAARAGSRAARLVEGEAAGGVVRALAGAGARAGTEGAIIGAGQGVSELALSDDPLTVERVASVIGSNTLFGAGTGGALGVAGKGIEIGLSKAKSSLDKLAAKGLGTGGEVGEDLATLDAKSLRAARRVEVEAIESARVPKRAELADEIKSFRKELKDNKLWLATKGSEDAEVRAIGERTLKADRALDNVLDDPKALAENPRAALSNLRKQEAALDELVNKHGEKLRASFAADASGTRAAALDYASTALEKNRALQAKIADISGKPASARLEAIEDALAGLGAAKKGDSTITEALGASALGHAVGALAGVPGLGTAVLAAKTVGGVMKKLGANSAAMAERGSQAIQTFLDVGAKVAPSARVLATKVLGEVRYGVEQQKKAARKTTSTLPDVYHARASEIRALTAPGPDGKPVMRMDARARMAERLAGVRAASPVLADRIETTKARGYEFLASKLPRNPDLPGIGLGPEPWQPADMAMRGWARYVAAVEDPHGIVERLADGTVTPEDAETMRTVYPEMYADIQRQILEQLGELQAKLPYQRRLALSIFSGIAVDPAMSPQVLAILQGQFETEEGSEGGTQAPTAQPQFGSVSREKPTPAQERSA